LGLRLQRPRLPAAASLELRPLRLLADYLARRPPQPLVGYSVPHPHLPRAASLAPRPQHRLPAGCLALRLPQPLRLPAVYSARRQRRRRAVYSAPRRQRRRLAASSAPRPRPPRAAGSLAALPL